jgi:hypothetical protein
MDNKWMSKPLRIATPMMIVCVVLALGASAVAQLGAGAGQSRRCSNRTLSGDYGTLILLKRMSVMGMFRQLRTSPELPRYDRSRIKDDQVAQPSPYEYALSKVDVFLPHSSWGSSVFE